jgi:hypothetical protein
MLNLAMQFQSSTMVLGDIKVARFDVQDVIVSDMEMFDDQELGMILVDPTGTSEQQSHLREVACIRFLTSASTEGRTYIATVAYPEIEYSNVDVETVRATSATVSLSSIATYFQIHKT